MAKRPTQPDPERAEKFIAEYQQKFSIAISAARDAAATTATAAWQLNYAMNMTKHREIIRLNSKSILELASHISAGDTSEIDEKAIKECVKTLTEERECFEAWKDRAVNAFRLAVENSRLIVDQCLVAARNAETEAGLMMHGVAVDVRKILARWPSATWDDETGVATVTEPDSAAASNAA